MVHKVEYVSFYKLDSNENFFSYSRTSAHMFRYAKESLLVMYSLEKNGIHVSWSH